MSDCFLFSVFCERQIQRQRPPGRGRKQNCRVAPPAMEWEASLTHHLPEGRAVPPPAWPPAFGGALRGRRRLPGTHPETLKNSRSCRSS